MLIAAVTFVVATSLIQADSGVADRVFRALGRGDVASVVRAVEAEHALVGAAEDVWRQTLLHRAVEMDLAVAVDALLARGASVEARDAAGRTPLHCASSAVVAARLIAAGADPAALDTSGNTPLGLAVKRSVYDAGMRIEALVEVGVPLDLTAAIRSGRAQWAMDELARSDGRRREILQDGRVLVEAARSGNVELIDALLGVGAPVNTRVAVDGTLDDYFERPLTVAVRAGHIATARRLLEAGATARGDFGWTERGGFQTWNGDDGDLLCRAIADGDTAMVRLLVAHGADVQSGPAAPRPDSILNPPPGPERCDTPLARAAWHGATKLVEILLAAGADVERLSSGMPPLHSAALAGHETLARRLVAAGACVDVWSAAALGWTPALQRILERDPSLVEAPCPRTGWTPLQCAIEWDRREAFELLVRAGARVDAATAGCFPGHSFYCSRLGVAPSYGGRRVLHDGGRSRAGTALDMLVATPLAHALKAQRHALAARLIALGAPIDARARDAARVAHAMVCDFVQLALRRNVAQYSTGPPLHAAAADGNVERIRALLRDGATVQLVNEDGETALHEAAARHQVEAIRALLAAGADVAARDDYGATALHQAASLRFRDLEDVTIARVHEVVILLLEAGAELSARTVRGETAAERLRRIWSIDEPDAPPPRELLRTLDPLRSGR